jgi:predicted nuclease of predicted toxin-antitoxin system
VQDVGLRTLDDETILAWASQEERIVLTHDRSTVIGFAYDRVRAGRPMPGVIEVSKDIAIGRAIEDILLIAVCVSEQEIDSQVYYVPQH